MMSREPSGVAAAGDCRGVRVPRPAELLGAGVADAGRKEASALEVSRRGLCVAGAAAGEACTREGDCDGAAVVVAFSRSEGRSEG